MKGVFVTGTDTNVGKTWVSAWLTKSWGAGYWKPIQSGTIEGYDADLVKTVAPNATIYPSRYALPEPLSPDQAAERAKLYIDLDDFELPPHDGPLVVEGAGGLLVPINDLTFMADLMERLGLPLVLVARTGLGTINHTLLSITEIRRRKLPLEGVILVGPPHPDNKDAIEHFGGVPVVAQLPPLADIAALAAHPATRWRP